MTEFIEAKIAADLNELQTGEQQIPGLIETDQALGITEDETGNVKAILAAGMGVVGAGCVIPAIAFSAATDISERTGQPLLGAGLLIATAVVYGAVGIALAYNNLHRALLLQGLRRARNQKTKDKNQ